MHNFAAGHRYVAVRGKAADAIVDGRAGGGVVDVDETVGLEVRVEGDPEQPAFPRGIHRDREERRGEQRPVLDHAQLAALLADEETTVRSELHRGRVGRQLDEDAVHEAARHRGRVPARREFAPEGEQHASHASPPLILCSRTTPWRQFLDAMKTQHPQYIQPCVISGRCALMTNGRPATGNTLLRQPRLSSRKKP